jgi:hypothetical protein
MTTTTTTTTPPEPPGNPGDYEPPDNSQGTGLLFVYSKFKDATLNFSIKNSYGDVINESSQIYDPDIDSFYYNVSLYETGAQVGINNSPYLVAENFISNETNLNFTFTQQQNSSYFSPDGAQRYYKLLLDIYNRGLKSSALATVYHYPAIITDISVDDGSTLIPIGTENESGFLTGYVNLNITFTGGIGKNYIVKNIDIYTGSQSGTLNSLNGFSLLKNVGVFSDSSQQTFAILPTEVPSNQTIFYKIIPYDDFGQGITFSNSVSGYLSYSEPLLFWGEALPPVLNSEARITGYFSGLESPERVSGRDGAIIFQDGEEIDQDFYVLKSGQWKRLAIYEEISGQLNGSSGDFSGYAVSGFDRSITGVTVTGDDVKTITLFKEDGSFLTASFTDNSAGGDSNTGYLTGYVAKTETGDFYPRSNPSGYVTGAVVRPSETGVFITNSQTGQFVGDSETGAFLTSGVANQTYVNFNSDQTISGIKSFYSGIVIYPSGGSDNNTFTFKNALDKLNPSLNALYLSPSGDLRRLFLGESSQRFFSINLENVGRFESFPETIQPDVDFTISMNWGTNLYLQHFPTKNSAILPINASEEDSYPLDGYFNFISNSKNDLSGKALLINTKYNRISGSLIEAQVTGLSKFIVDVSGNLSGNGGSFNQRPTVNSVAVALTGDLTGYVNKNETGAFVINSQTGAFLTTGAADFRYVSLTSGQTVSGEKTFHDETRFESGVNFSGKLKFYTGFTSEVFDGEVSWDREYGTLQVGMNNGEVINPLGFKSFYRVKANQNIAQGKVVMAVGAVGNSEFILAQEASNIGASGELIMGISAEPISAGNFGDVVAFGPVRGVDTSSFNEGAVLYFDTQSTGRLTQTPPQAPNAKVITAFSLNQKNNGVVFVRVTAGSVLGGSDSNVKFSALKEGDFISYSAASGFWYNRSLTTGDVSGISSFALKSETGQFYPASNPSGFITGVDLSSYATTVYVTGVSGHLQNQINNLNNATGSYVTGTVVRPSDTGNIVIGTITLSLNGGGSAITTGYKSFTSVNYSGEILSYTLLADKTGSIVIDIWKDSYANYPPTSGDSICASSKPTLSSQISNTDSVLTSWSKSFSAGDVFGFNVDSSSVVTNINLTLKVKKA